MAQKIFEPCGFLPENFLQKWRKNQTSVLDIWYSKVFSMPVRNKYYMIRQRFSKVWNFTFTTFLQNVINKKFPEYMVSIQKKLINIKICTGTPPLTRFFGPVENWLKGKPSYRRSILVLKLGNGTLSFLKSPFWANLC